jgi:pyridoxamine 5'-phosphate oxidase
MSIRRLRNEYSRATLGEHDLAADPILQFEAWFAQALEAEVPEPHAMTLATAAPDGRPSARIVLMRGYDDRGFTFFTNYESRKGRELDGNPHAALVFFWPALERQVRVEGRVVRVTEAESEDYFHSRPAGSRLAAWASEQSAVVPDRAVLERRFEEFRQRYHDDAAIPRPPNWGGYRVVHELVEFWQGRPSRLHDRLRFTRLPDGTWRIERLAP